MKKDLETKERKQKLIRKPNRKRSRKGKKRGGGGGDEEGKRCWLLCVS